MTNPTKPATLAQLAVQFPRASSVFRREGLDYCCGGDQSFDEACSTRGLDAATLMQEIESAADDATPDWSKMPLGALVAHIVQRYHEPLRRELPELVELAAKVERVHADKASVPKGLHAHLQKIHGAVLEHLAKEEQVLFPIILAGQGARAGAPVHAMETEHDDHGRNLRHIRELTDDLNPPEEACTTWRALYLRLRELEAELMDHIHLENNVLFPRALCE